MATMAVRLEISGRPWTRANARGRKKKKKKLPLRFFTTITP